MLIFTVLNHNYLTKAKPRILTADNITEIYCKIDDFYKELEQSMKGISLEEDSIKEAKKRAFLLSDSEVITILTLFHLGNYRNLKHFYLFYVQKHLTAEFPKTVAYNRFVELQKKALLPMIIFMKMKSLGECTGISFIDSTKLPVCNNRRIHNHHVFKDIATR